MMKCESLRMIRLQMIAGAGFALALGFAAPAAAEVMAVSEGGFVSAHAVSVGADPLTAYRVFTDIAAWWSDAHTYSGAARAMRLKPVPGGCWCERLKGGGFVEHMRVVQAMPGEALVMAGGLGPLGVMTANGVMHAAFAPGPDGGAQVTLTYTVAGFAPGGFAGIAGPVDEVLAEQTARFAARFEAPAKAP